MGWDEVRMLNPLFAEDIFWSESNVLSVKDSGLRRHAGIVTVKTIADNQCGVTVCSFKRTFMVHRRDSGMLS